MNNRHDNERATELTTLRTPRNPRKTVGSEGLWIFVFIDMAIFALLFFVFMADRLEHFALYKNSQPHLNEIFGLVNTLVLLTSSWLVVEAVHAARGMRPERLSRNLALALICGGLFCVSKFIEYHAKISAGIGPAKNSFFAFYFFITFIHFLHVVAGMLCLNSFRRRSASCLNSAAYVTGIENVGLFWHYVDVLWIFIFPLLYLI